MFLVLLFMFVDVITCFDSRNVVFTIVSQSEPYHASVATRLKQDIEHQVFELEGRRPVAHVTHEDFPVGGAWTIIPLLRPLTDKHRGGDVRWVVFLEPHTAVRCGKLIEALTAADGQKDTMWIGYPLSDEEPTIIHHFTFYCGSAIAEETILFAVKTWSGFHATRVSVVKKTWGKYVTNLYFFSDKADPSIPTIDIGVPNTKTGHCAKTMAILNRVVEMIEDMPNIQWIFLADDDTILGVQRVCELLSCYGGAARTLLGERYGYGYTNTGNAAKGYDYITGGGGTVLSAGAARALRSCACAAPAAPDDMTLGACAKRRNITLTHSPLFHQVYHYFPPFQSLNPHRYCQVQTLITKIPFCLFSYMKSQL
ncbi:PREDICTED: beta-1,3-glucosyltransferase [Papilio polytes]|uniref:beta-1,3-glucosyltransferase n=1 Tax=Papilio polytes TaxID=76194 RepID=UPI00067643A7|nr:PREDICTED: beta-1,3-glucosyltransferase [Papilio polytes]